MDEKTRGQSMLERLRAGQTPTSSARRCSDVLTDKSAGRPSSQHCGECGGLLWEVRLPGGEWVLADCIDCLKRQRDAEFIQEALEEGARFSPLHAGATLDNFVADLPHQERGLAAARAFLADVCKGRPLALVLWACNDARHTGYGTGKTHLASGIANELRGRGWIVESWIMPEWLSEIRASYDGDGESEHAIVRRAVCSDLLVIDDLGKEHVSGERGASWYQEKIFRIVNARYNRGPLLMTTNLHAKQLPDALGGAAFSRLWEMTDSGERIVDMCGPDWRFK